MCGHVPLTAIATSLLPTRSTAAITATCSLTDAHSWLWPALLARWGEGNWSVGVIVDDGASVDQVDALTKIATGATGGPMANLAPLIGKVLGIEKRPIEIHTNGMTHSAKAGELLDQASEGVPGANEDEPFYIGNVGHPSNSRLALARATRSHLHAFGLDWDDVSGENNGHFSTFRWSGGA
jgi:hypothetical protein